MPSTYSSTLRLELIGAGEQDGTWGTTTNTNLGTLIEQAITGVESITMADANYTLSNFNGLPDEARNAVLVMTGTLTGVRSVITPAVEKLYVVKNSTSGGFGITIKTASGSGVTVPTGATQIVYCDGTDFYLAASQTNVLAGTGISVSTAGINSTVSNTGVLSFNTRTGVVTLTSGDVTTALGYTPPTPTGTGASGTWGISVTGNAATATNPASGGSFITSSNIGSQSVNYASSSNYANSSGSSNYVAWGNVGGRPTAVSQFTNDSGYITTPTGLGWNGTVWRDVTGSRSSGVTYTNSRSYPIMVSMWAVNNYVAEVSMYVSGSRVSFHTIGTGSGYVTIRTPIYTIVPAGATYLIYGAIEGWWELY